MVPYTHNRAAGEKQHNATNYQLSLVLLLYMDLELLLAMLGKCCAPAVLLVLNGNLKKKKITNVSNTGGRDKVKLLIT